MKIFDLPHSGYTIVDAEQPEILVELRKRVYAFTKQVFGLTESDPNIGLNHFHKGVEKKSDGEFNSKRVELISQITKECDVSELVFRAFETYIFHLLGPDILAQKTANLVLQPPGDPNPSELHRDAPANSPYEVVVWVPMVDCYRTKSMYIVNAKDSESALLQYETNPTNWDNFIKSSRSKASNPTVLFGQALFFYTGCLHGSEINREEETRVSFNIRYKSLFAPPGLKSQISFFKPFRISNFTRLGSQLEVKELLK